MAISETVSNYGGQAINWITLGFAALIIIAVIFLFYRMYARWRKFQEFSVIIWGKDGFGQVIQKRDKAGIFVSRATKNKRLFLQRNNVGLSPDNIPYIQCGKQKVIYLIQEGLKNFRFLKPDIRDSTLKFAVGEEDVNWGLHAYETSKRLFSTNPLLQYLPFIIIGFVTVIILIIFIYFFRQFGVLKDVALAFQEASKNLILAQGGSGTVVVGA